MKKTCKRLGAVLLAAFLMLSTMVCANAADNDTVAPANAKTVTLNVNNVSDGDTVSAYQLVSYTADYNGYTFFDGDNNNGFESYVNANKTNQSLTAEEYLASLDSAGVNSLLEGYATACKQDGAQYKLPDAAAAGNGFRQCRFSEPEAGLLSAAHADQLEEQPHLYTGCRFYQGGRQ